MNFRLRRFIPGMIVWLLAALTTLQADDLIKPGTKLDSLTVGRTTYQQVTVRSVGVHTVMITHSGGMASILLRDLPPEWQARFRYNPVADAAAEEAAKNAPPPPPVVHRPKPGLVTGATGFDALLQKFGQPATLQAEVDLRPKFFQLELGVKNQGSRPSCAIFSIVSALEFQNADVSGKVEKFSEEYLIWAVRKTTQRLPVPGAAPADPAASEYQDEGFSLEEVVSALRAYGIPLQATMPNTFGRRIEAIEDPPPDIVREARNHQRVSAQKLPGRDRGTLLNNIVHALNSGVPVPVGIAWPRGRVANGYLGGKSVGSDRGHAVTLVGYKSASGRAEDTYFIFKNSWGPNWGQGGYGTVTYQYLENYLFDAVLLEVQHG